MVESRRGGMAAGEHERSDEELASAARVDRAAFAPLYRRYADPVYRYCLRRLRSPEAAEDIAAAIFERALIGLPRFTPRSSGSFRSWLFAIAHNTISNVERDRTFASSLDDALTVIDPAPGPEETLHTAETHEEVWAMIATLPPLYQRILELRMVELRGREIAEVLGISHSAVKSAQFRAFTRLRDLLAAGAARETRS